MSDLDWYDKMYVDGFFCRSDLAAIVERLRKAEKDADRWRKLIEINDNREIGKRSIVIQKTDGNYDFPSYMSMSGDEVAKEVDAAIHSLTHRAVSIDMAINWLQDNGFKHDGCAWTDCGGRVARLEQTLSGNVWVYVGVA